MKLNQENAIAFAAKYHGEIVGKIEGNIRSTKTGKPYTAGYKIEIDGHMIHAYSFRVWHRKNEGISISDKELQLALDENALILKMKDGIEYVLDAETWQEWVEQDKSREVHTRFGHMENFIRKDNLRILNLNKYPLYRYYTKTDDE